MGTTCITPSVSLVHGSTSSQQIYTQFKYKIKVKQVQNLVFRSRTKTLSNSIQTVKDLTKKINIKLSNITL
ncbi:hypothetical protein BpHYR1_004544 [Brachionus plicatilis]|uniref:Uncharacterized protein n=1 Tax=Brachionus plicatilis TaxID=10195 RepID=A0A3M7PX32_BRAPC|nr:hypothetical protein BpHYR1_004544 [Brachionus plicatilis]